MIVCTGPISSGTRLLTQIVADLHAQASVDEEVMHRSMPHWDQFWDWRDEKYAGARFVIIVRRPDYSVRSAFVQGHGNPALSGWAHLDHRMTHDELAAWWWRAMGILSTIPDAYWMSYEALVASPGTQVSSLSRHLGLGEVKDWGSITPVYDANKKWREFQWARWGEQRS